MPNGHFYARRAPSQICPLFWFPWSTRPNKRSRTLTGAIRSPLMSIASIAQTHRGQSSGASGVIPDLTLSTTFRIDPASLLIAGGGFVADFQFGAGLRF